MQKSFIAQDIECFLSMFNQSQIPLHTKHVMLIVKGTHEGRTHDIHYLLWIIRTKIYFTCVSLPRYTQVCRLHVSSYI